MSNIEIFIREHRNELDVFTPSTAVWSGIEAGMHQPTFLKSTTSWLKYAGFSASVIAVLVYLKTNSTEPAITHALASEQKVQTSEIIVPPPSPVTEVSQEKIIASQLESVTPSYKAEERNEVSTAPVTSTSARNEDITAPIALSTPPQIAASPTPSVRQQPSSGMLAVSKDSIKIDTSFAGVNTLEVDCSSFDINITAVAGDKITFKANSKSESHGLIIGKRKRSIKYERTNDVLKITEVKESKDSNGDTTSVNCKQSKDGKGSKGDVIIGCHTESSHMSFEVPASTNVILHSSYGDIKVSGLQNKSTTIHARSGDVKLENLATELDLSMGYGDLSGNGMTGNVSGKVSSGDITFTNLKGNVDITTSYGDQHYKDVTGNIKAQCSSGDLKINSMKGDLDIDSKYGDISLEDFKGNTMLHTSSGDIKGKNVELTEKMEANTSYGDIKMKFVNPLSALSFDLETNYGDIRIDKDGQNVNENKKLVLKNGNILVKAHTSSGDQSYK